MAAREAKIASLEEACVKAAEEAGEARAAAEAAETELGLVEARLRVANDQVADVRALLEETRRSEGEVRQQLVDADKRARYVSMIARGLFGGEVFVWVFACVYEDECGDQKKIDGGGRTIDRMHMLGT